MDHFLNNESDCEIVKMDSEIALIEFGQGGTTKDNHHHHKVPSFFDTTLEQRIGMIASAAVLTLCLIAILFLVLRIRCRNRERRQGGSTSRPSNSLNFNSGMLDRNVEIAADIPYARKYFYTYHFGFLCDILYFKKSYRYGMLIGFRFKQRRVRLDVDLACLENDWFMDRIKFFL